MADTLKRYYNTTIGTSSGTATNVTVGTAGAVIRNIHVCNTNATTATINMAIGTAGSSAYPASGAGALYATFSIPANGVHIANVNIVMDPSEKIWAYTNGNTGVAVTISGVDL